MKISRIANHLSKRGYATRKIWGGQRIIAFGMDNQPQFWSDKTYNFGTHHFCLADFTHNDWIKLPYRWDGSTSGFDILKYDKKLIELRKNERNQMEYKDIEKHLLKLQKIINDTKDPEFIAFMQDLLDTYMANVYGLGRNSTQQ